MFDIFLNPMYSFQSTRLIVLKFFHLCLGNLNFYPVPFKIKIKKCFRTKYLLVLLFREEFASFSFLVVSHSTINAFFYQRSIIIFDQEFYLKTNWLKRKHIVNFDFIKAQLKAFRDLGSQTCKVIFPCFFIIHTLDLDGILKLKREYLTENSFYLCENCNFFVLFLMLAK